MLEVETTGRKWSNKAVAGATPKAFIC